MVGGTIWLPSKNDSFNVTGLGRLATQDGFSTMKRSSEKNSDLRSQSNCEGELAGVKGQDEVRRDKPVGGRG
jgi:hypothetical protein